ncbi:primosomal protein N' [uncultured Fusobacterium sp.]|uniref:replication restart helicase PriA n=1 Tax=uncultured Fusobacterium sp. TaxID=159267 RepID=UPI0025EEAE46|nr:primosomal protein N' [uncultured Fusobacterium sp.]
MRYYKIYVDNTRELYTYEDRENKYEIGDRVIVSFRGKQRTGLIIAQDTDEERAYKVLPIQKIVENSIKLSESYIKLLVWIKNYYMSSYEQVITAAIPSGLSIKYESFYFPRDIEEFLKTDIIDGELREYFKKRVTVTKGALTKNFGLDLINALIKMELLLREGKVNITLNYSKREELEEKEKSVYEYFKKRERVKEESLEKLFSKKELEKLLKSGDLRLEKLIKSEEEKVVEDIDKEIESRDKQLNEEQEKAKMDILTGKESFFLLKGITGSGKTEVYISIIKSAFNEGKGSIFLVPEISLTPQMIDRFKGEFKENIAILHSKLTQSERAKEWYDIYSGRKKVVLGVRSAIFAPVQNLGYIFLDEEHETTYKQDNNPRYNAKQVAIKRVELEGAKLVLGSATPSIESFYFAQKGIFKLIELKNRYNNAVLPEVEIVDMKGEESLYFSKRLLDEIRKTLLKGEQVLLLLNRKGYSTYIQCKDCGHVEECSHCSIKYSYYASQGVLKCNYCGRVKRYTGQCSNCGSKNLIHSGKGVERVEEEIKKYFDVRVIRVDSEMSKDREFFEKMYYDFLDKKYDIMVGTQLISKGLHFPDVTLVGVVNADTILNFPDFRAGEKTYQLVTQVAGRAGRGDKRGRVIVQTYQSEHPVFKRVKTNDYEGFYKEEIYNRELLEYPPFSKTINIGISSKYEKYLEEFVKDFFRDIKYENVEMYGPMRSMVYKVKDRFRYNIFIKGNIKEINIFKKKLKLKLTNYEKNDKIRIVVDVDPINLI